MPSVAALKAANFAPSASWSMSITRSPPEQTSPTPCASANRTRTSSSLAWVLFCQGFHPPWTQGAFPPPTAGLPQGRGVSPCRQSATAISVMFKFMV